MTMTNAVIECILSRSAAKYYDPAVTLSDDQIRELVQIGTTAPTSGDCSDAVRVCARC